LPEWQTAFQGASNKAGLAGHMLQTLYPTYYASHAAPNYGFLGKLLDGNDPDYVLSLIWKHAARPPAGDPVRFLSGVLKKEPKPSASGWNIPG
jgi:hypothetical protein